MTHVFPSGRRPVMRLSLGQVKQIEATGNHPFLTYQGWRPLADLAVGARLAVPRHLPPPQQITPWCEAEVIMLAHVLGAGSFVRRQPNSLRQPDEETFRRCANAARHFRNQRGPR